MNRKERVVAAMYVGLGLIVLGLLVLISPDLATNDFVPNRVAWQRPAVIPTITIGLALQAAGWTWLITTGEIYE